MRSKKYMIARHILPYFKNKRLNEITPSDIIAWQNIIRSKGYSQVYMRMLQNQIAAIFNHAQKIYNLTNNPCRRVKKIGKSNVRNLEFWMYQEYEKFINSVDRESIHYVIFEILFWTGCRIGELLALMMDDINFETNQLHINNDNLD